MISPNEVEREAKKMVTKAQNLYLLKLKPLKVSMFILFISKFNATNLELVIITFYYLFSQKSTPDRLDNGFTQVSLKTKSIVYWVFESRSEGTLFMRFFSFQCSKMRSFEFMLVTRSKYWLWICANAERILNTRIESSIIEIVDSQATWRIKKSFEY